MYQSPTNDAWFWRRKVWKLSYPIILSNLFIPLPGIVDTAVLGRLDDESYLGGVALSAVIYSFIYWGVAFLRKGTTGLGAQAYGAKDMQEVWAVLFRAIGMAVFLAILLIVIQIPIAWLSFWAFEASEQVEIHAQTYYYIRIWGAPASFLNFVFVGWLLALQDSKRPMILQIIVNILNVILDLWFVLGLEMTVDGVALATVIAEYAGVIVGLYFIFGRRDLWPETGLSKSVIWNWQKVKRMTVVNRELFIRSLLLMFAFAYQTAEAAKIGDTFLAATVILGHLFHICSFGLDGFAHANETLVGQAVGAKDRKTFSAVNRASFELGLLVALGMSGIYYISGEYWIGFFTDLPELIAVSSEYLIWMVLMPLFGMWCFIFDGIYFGSTHVVETRKAMIISVGGYLLSMQILVPTFDEHGVMAGMCVLMTLRGLTQWYYYPALRDSIPMRKET